MLKERARLIANALLGADLFMVAAAFLAAYGLRSVLFPYLGWVSQPLYPLHRYMPLLPLVLLIWGVLLQRSGAYRSHRTITLVDEAWDLLKVCSLGGVLLVLVIYALRLDEKLLGGDQISRLWIFLFLALAGLLVLSLRVLVRLLSHYVRSRGYNYRTVLLVGTRPKALEIADSIARHRYWGYRVLGLVQVRPTEQEVEELGGYPVLGTLQDIPRLLSEQVVDEVIFAVHRPELNEMEDLLLSLEERGVIVRLALDLFPHAKATVQIGDLDGTPLLTFSTTPSNQLLLASKRLIDLAISLLLLLLALPVMGLIALVIRLTSGSGVLFRQTRCGLNGRRFTLYKFRTMVRDAETRRREIDHLNEMTGPVFKSRRDPRVTRFGRLLRRFSLDELPQLWNVLSGAMSLVGPRPPIPEEVAQYQPWQRRRLSMRPGLTCLWQISGRNEVDFERWMELDLEYIDTWSPALDLKILAKTIPVVLSGRGA